MAGTALGVVVNGPAGDTLRFGWFSADREMVTTVDGRVLQCEHLASGRVYLLRVAGSSATPLSSLSAENASVERGQARATAAATRRLYPRWYLDEHASPPSSRLVLPEYYGVRDDRYLFPASATYRKRGAVGFDVVLAMPAFLIQILPFWENLTLLLDSETSLLGSGTVPLDTWELRWAALIRDSTLGRRLIDRLPEGLPGRVAARIAALVDEPCPAPGPSLESSLPLRLMACFTGKRLDPVTIHASLSCPFFRLNVTTRDLEIVVALARLMQPVPWLFQPPLEWLGPSVLVLPTIIEGLQAQPKAFPDEQWEFEACSPPSEEDLDGYTVFVADPERTVRPYPGFRPS